MVIPSDKLESSLSMRKSEFILKILYDYGVFIEHSLNISLNDDDKKPASKPAPKPANPEENQEGLETENESPEAKSLMKLTENSIECKLLSLELIKTLTNYFIKGKSVALKTEK